MKIAIGADHNGYDLKEVIKAHVEQLGHEVEDFGCHNCAEVDYPDVAVEVGKSIQQGNNERGILICGTGIGVAITANKLNGIRAAMAHDYYSAERAQLSNNAQILTMGAQIIGPEVAKKNVEAYLSVAWEGGSQRKVDKIDAIDNSEKNK
ncbi:ribose 5-phosphate isomerase B [Staphylococcus simiae]|uniref:ribose 5-phosphate isomerase B n=1 Tax=Staphylococcus simiae TaxID=308354 RepID=UPI001A96F55E|nr:ribose 5-phosphate isomerase B [Staphylococcus simiae]MBO1198399.1 ribose 5-phosphate isomerase B [Staphylococcus simiae]MBO1200593.1 ribose 5-phosphate isomerase B [Staphylococcus simiae]MBO1202864.1 ribose 5-phosphate isomerase B [Staphylococcus simiae]MBO1210391.1 ribose 5-phosphate isomerase B [Staphylococcus simiae]MBO1228930.1 ribose 5-phosphate isomerase B [Staphylococcus simiae]